MKKAAKRGCLLRAYCFSWPELPTRMGYLVCFLSVLMFSVLFRVITTHTHHRRGGLFGLLPCAQNQKTFATHFKVSYRTTRRASGPCSVVENEATPVP